MTLANEQRDGERATKKVTLGNPRNARTPPWSVEAYGGQNRTKEIKKEPHSLARIVPASVQ